jgi:hypothetical protein
MNQDDDYVRCVTAAAAAAAAAAAVAAAATDCQLMMCDKGLMSEGGVYVSSKQQLARYNYHTQYV